MLGGQGYDVYAVSDTMMSLLGGNLEVTTHLSRNSQKLYGKTTEFLSIPRQD